MEPGSAFRTTLAAPDLETHPQALVEPEGEPALYAEGLRVGVRHQRRGAPATAPPALADKLPREMSQVVQIVGALAILVAFVAAQLGVFDVRSWSYLWLNLVGALILGVVAWHERQYGFLLLEIVWTMVTAWGLVTRARGAQA